VEYDEGEYYIHSTDRKGHGSSLRVQVPPDIARRIHVLIVDPRLPYKTPNDLIRDAIVHRIAKLESDLPDLEPSINVFVREALLGQRIAQRESSERLATEYYSEMEKASPAERASLRDEIADAIEDETLTETARKSLQLLLDRFQSWNGDI
jgi:hypothetical protein